MLLCRVAASLRGGRRLKQEQHNRQTAAGLTHPRQAMCWQAGGGQSTRDQIRGSPHVGISTRQTTQRLQQLQLRASCPHTLFDTSARAPRQAQHKVVCQLCACVVAFAAIKPQQAGYAAHPLLDCTKRESQRNHATERATHTCGRNLCSSLCVMQHALRGPTPTTHAHTPASTHACPLHTACVCAGCGGRCNKMGPVEKNTVLFWPSKPRQQCATHTRALPQSRPAVLHSNGLHCHVVLLLMGWRDLPAAQSRREWHGVS